MRPFVFCCSRPKALASFLFVAAGAAILSVACAPSAAALSTPAGELLKSATLAHAAAEAPVERRTFIHGVLCIDSVSFGNSEDAGLVVATGSHGGAIAAGMTRSFRPRLAFFNDAGFGADRAGAASLPILDSEGIAAATVAAIRRVSVTASRR
jgi:hypothetical protein